MELQPGVTGKNSEILLAKSTVANSSVNKGKPAATSTAVSVDFPISEWPDTTNGVAVKDYRGSVQQRDATKMQGGTQAWSHKARENMRTFGDCNKC